MFYGNLAEPPPHDGSDSNSKATSTANLTIEAKATRIAFLYGHRGSERRKPHSDRRPGRHHRVHFTAISGMGRDRLRAAGIELLFNFTKFRVFTVLPTVNQMNWSQMELTNTN